MNFFQPLLTTAFGFMALLHISLVYAQAAPDSGFEPMSFVNFESPHVHPIDKTPNNNRLLAVNTAANTLMVFDISSGTPQQINTIPVGLDPVSVRAQSNNRAWVVNHISDTVSVVDLSLGVVIATLQTDNEPTDVVFAGQPERAFVSCSEANTLNVFNPNNVQQSPVQVAINGEDPRAMAVSADGSEVYVAIFESGNATTVVSGGATGSIASERLGNGIAATAGPYGGAVAIPPNNGNAITPAMNSANPDPRQTSLIVRKNTQNQWIDDNNVDWSAVVSGTASEATTRVSGWDMPDRDVAIVNANTLSVSYQHRLMNIVMGIDVNPSSGEVSVVGTDATNEVRFEPNLNGTFLRVELARFFPNSANPPVAESESSMPSVSVDSVSTGKAYTVTDLQMGVEAYMDRDYQITSIPSSISALSALVQTSNGDKAVDAANHISLSLSSPAQVCVAYDSRISSPPSWLDTFTATGEDIVTDDAGGLAFRVYCQDTSGGVVSLSGNAAQIADQSHYLLFVQPESNTGAVPDQAFVLDLNNHLSYSSPSTTAALRQRSIGDPRAIRWNQGGDKAYVVGMGSNNVVEVNSDGERTGVPLSVGEGPTGITLDESRNRAYVLNKFDGSISVVQLSNLSELSRVAFFDPTPRYVKDGRPVLYNTHTSSGLGQVACASCHVDARTDRLAWDLGDPTAAMSSRVASDGVTYTFHPMKGPMKTQTLQDIIGVQAMHHSGDKNNLFAFASTFPNLQGASTPSGDQMIALESMLDSIHYPPNPNRLIDNTLSRTVTLQGPNNTVFDVADAVAGKNAYFTGQNTSSRCSNCHLGPRSRNDIVKSAGNDFVQSVPLIAESLSGFYDRVGFWVRSQTGSNVGFGFRPDGAQGSEFFHRTRDFPKNTESGTDILAYFVSIEGPQSDVSGLSRDSHAGVGQQVTITGSGDLSRANTLASIADSGNVGLVATGIYNNQVRGFVYLGDGRFQSDAINELVDKDALFSQATVAAPLTVTLVPIGSGYRIAIDADLDGHLNADEVANSSRPDIADTTAWTLCANQGQDCQVNSTSVMRYGAGEHMLYRVVDSTFECNNLLLGNPSPDSDKQCFLRTPAVQADFDNDGIPDAIDPDDDNDGIPDVIDDFPFDASESEDFDGDGIGNNADTDDDNDGVPDEQDLDPLDPNVGAGPEGDQIAIGDSLSGTLGLREWAFYTVSNMDGSSYAMAELTALSANINLYVEHNEEPGLYSFHCKSTRGGTEVETCGVNVLEGTSIIGVYAKQAGSYTLNLNALTQVKAIPNSGARDDTVQSGSWVYYKVNNAANQASVQAQLSGLQADANLYVKLGTVPTLTNYDCRSKATWIDDESCTINPVGRDVYIGVFGSAQTPFQLDTTSN